jgi:hypothetical protein
LDKVIVPNSEIHSKCKEYWSNFLEEREWTYENIFGEVDKQYAEFKRSAQKEVNYLVKEFECRKAADSYARASTARTGVLDCSKLHTYKYNEDIFRKVTTLADEDASSLANEIVYAITAYDEAKDLVEGDEDSVENGIVTNTTTAGYSEERFNALTEVVLEMAKKNEELEVKLSKVPTGKAISEMEFKSDDSAADSMLEARIAAIKNLNK